MAPLDQYLMTDQGAEVALARSAAPEPNAAAAHSYLRRITKITDLILSGHTKAQVIESIAAAVDKKELPPMESGAMCYMVSKQGYAGDSAEHWPPHLMFFYSQTDPAGITISTYTPTGPLRTRTCDNTHFNSN
jgi:hypothetical protein